MSRPVRFLAPRLLAVLSIVACESATDGSPRSPLAGLTQSAARDSAGTSIPTGTAGTTGDGFARGTVIGPSAPGAGNDSLNTAPRIAGVRVAAYKVLGGTAANPVLGAEAAAVVTGTDGKFTLPTLPGGEYRVTFTPPSTSVYAGVWVTGALHSGSSTHPWWVTLPRK